MNLKKIVTLLSMVLAAIALAVPTSASARPIFTHDGEPIGHGKSKQIQLSGPVALLVGNVGIHCTHVTTTVLLEATGTGTVTSFSTEKDGKTTCTTTPDNFIAHTQAKGLPWTLHSDGHEELDITGLDVLTKITHPSTSHLVVAEREATGSFSATIPFGQKEEIQTLTLSGEGSVHLFPGTLSATVSGDLEITTNTLVGTATVDTD